MTTIRAGAPSGAADRAARGRLIALALAVAAAFVGLGAVRLGVQGAHHDELHQVPAAFGWLGAEPWWFCRAPVHGIALFTMPYSGALKSALYGLYMKWTGQGFVLWQWRLFGLGLVGAGVGVLTAATLRRAGGRAAGVLALFCLTDATLLLASRHDWGPMALGFALRAGALALWLWHESRWSAGAAVGFGLLAGLAVYDKLHTLAMLPALVLLLVLADEESRVRRLLAAAGGFVVGIAPVVLVNLRSLWESGVWFSLQGGSPAVEARWLAYFWEVSRLGIGSGMRARVLAAPPSAWLGWLEGALLLTGLAALVATLIAGRSRRLFALTVGWASIVVALELLPRETQGHHWILATPWLYLALALALGTDLSRRTRRFVAGLCAVWLLLRLVSLGDLERQLLAGRAAPAWHPNHTRFARWASVERPDDAFIVGHWGLGMSLYAETQGGSHRVFQAWAHPRGEGPWLRPVGGRTVHVVAIVPNPFPRTPDATAATLEDLRANPAWRERPAPADLRGFPPVVVWSFEPVSP